jgi:hypothetical protein
MQASSPSSTNMEDLSTMTLALVVGKLVASKMSRMMGQEEAAS